MIIDINPHSHGITFRKKWLIYLTTSPKRIQDDLLAAVADVDAMIIRSDIVDQVNGSSDGFCLEYGEEI